MRNTIAARAKKIWNKWKHTNAITNISIYMYSCNKIEEKSYQNGTKWAIEASHISESFFPPKMDHTDTHTHIFSSNQTIRATIFIFACWTNQNLSLYHFLYVGRTHTQIHTTFRQRKYRMGGEDAMSMATIELLNKTPYERIMLWMKKKTRNP